MTPEEIKAEFARHPAASPLMKAFRAWLDAMREDELECVCASRNLDGTFVADGDRQFRAGRVSQSAYALEVFDGVMAEAEKAREEADRAKH